MLQLILSEALALASDIGRLALGCPLVLFIPAGIARWLPPMVHA
jgi:hypothetical protein